MVNQRNLLSQLITIFDAGAPPFVFVQEPPTSAVSSAHNTVQAALEKVSETGSREDDGIKKSIAYATVDCAAAFTSRLLFDGILSGLNESTGIRDSVKENLLNQKTDSLDSFIHALEQVFAQPSGGSGSEKVDSLVLVFERVERLRSALPGLIYPLSRLYELVRSGPIITVFLSEVSWEHITLISGTSPDPYLITLDPPNKTETLSWIIASFPTETSNSISVYNTILHSLFSHFVETVYDVCAPFIPSEEHKRELAYIAAARWPEFVKPVLANWRLISDEASENQDDGEVRDETREDDGELRAEVHFDFEAPTEEMRIRMLRSAASSLAGAVERLYPRLASADEVWGPPKATKPSQSSGNTNDEDALLSLPRLASFILLAGYLASHNPARTDARMFSRTYGREGRGRKKGGGTRKTRVGGGKVAKLPQRLLGPTTFAYDRLIAILGALLVEYDDSESFGRINPNEYPYVDGTDGGSYGYKAEVDVYRVQTTASIQELVSLRLMLRTSAPDKLDSPTFRCNLMHPQALRIARRLGVPLGELLWEPN